MHMIICFQGYGSDGLKLLSHEESVSFGESVLKLTFDPGTVEDGLLTVECKLDHPFYVKNKGRVPVEFTNFTIIFMRVRVFSPWISVPLGLELLSCQLNPRSLEEQPVLF